LCKLSHGCKYRPRPRILAAMTSILRTLEFLALGVCVGSGVFLSFAVAPAALRILWSRDRAASLAGSGLGARRIGGIICGFAIIAARLLRTRTFASLATPAALCVVLMIALTAISQYTVSPKMA